MKYRNTHSSNTRQLLSRRELLAGGAAGAGLALLPWSVSSLAAALPENPKQAMRQRKIPATGETLPVVGMGSSGSYERMTDANAKALRTVMQEFVELGGTLIDTSPTYGNAERNIGQVTQELGLRDQLFMATKVNAPGKQAGIEQMAGSRQALDEPIDLLQVHNLVELETQWATLKKMKADGRVRYIGITHYLTHAFDELEKQMKSKDMDFIQFNYSIVTPEAEKRLLPLAAEKGIAVLVNRAFEDGRIFNQVNKEPLPDYASEFNCHSWAQFALKYVLADEAVTAVIPATGKPKHLRDNMQAGYGALPDAAMRKRMRKTMASL